MSKSEERLKSARERNDAILAIFKEVEIFNTSGAGAEYLSELRKTLIEENTAKDLTPKNLPQILTEYVGRVTNLPEEERTSRLNPDVLGLCGLLIDAALAGVVVKVSVDDEVEWMQNPDDALDMIPVFNWSVQVTDLVQTSLPN